MKHRICIFVLLLTCLAGNAAAQGFGRNKVQYGKFSFQVLVTEHFDILYYPEERGAAEQAGRMAERWYTRLSQVFGHQLTGRQSVVLYASHPAFSQTTVIEGELGEGTGGVTESARRRVIMPLAASLTDTDHVLGHELVHAFQYDMLGPNAEGMPLWFIEGMAEYLSIGGRDAQTAMWMRDAAMQNKLPALKDLDQPRYFPYRYGHALWAYVAGKWGDQVFGAVLARLGPVGGQGTIPMGVGSKDAITAIEENTGRDQEALAAEWHASIYETYHLTRPDPKAPAIVSTNLIGRKGDEGGAVNVGPSISPDGTKIAFLSERDRLSIDLFIADAATGKILKKLTDTATDPHFESLQFLASAGAWSPDGKKLSLGTVQSGHPVLSIIDVEKGSITREIPLKDMGEVFQPAWSPDGASIAFSAQSNGVSDLFVIHLASGELRRLTDDQWADLQPTWTPDGKTLTFVSDRFTGDLATLAFRGYKLASIAINTAAVTPMAIDVPGSVTNPSWGTDPNTLYFLSDSGGRQNAYRVDVPSGRVVRLTDEPTGIAGITPLSPALSVSARGDRGAVSVFRDGGYDIKVIDPRQGMPVTSAILASADYAVLPPVARRTDGVVAMLKDATTGLPKAAEFTEQKYKPKLHLLGVSQQVGVATNSNFGTYVGGGINLAFGDTLGEHLVTTGASINGGVRDLAAQLGYLNRKNRLNWSVFTEHVPLVTGQISASLSPDQTLIIEQTDLFRQTYTQAGASVAYPFSRVLRLEVGATGRHIGFSQETILRAYDSFSGVLVAEEKQDVDSGPGLNLFDVNSALVRDTSVFGATSPILGQRLRLEVTPTFGDLTLTNITADYRQYFMPKRPVTFAGRLLHAGRYGTSSEDERLMPFFLGYSTLVRGYNVNSFDVGDCTPNATSSCPEFDRMVGSRILVANLEVRAPLVGLFKGRLDYGALPVEIFAFSDSGLAWTKTEKPSFASGPREWISSAGFGARVNVLGFLIAEINLAKAINRPARGWMWVFNLRPGF